VKDGYHVPILELITPDGSELHALEFADRPALYVMMRQVADQVERIGAIGLIHTAEAWFASASQCRASCALPERNNSSVSSACTRRQ
jgi:hypothetical protein